MRSLAEARLRRTRALECFAEGKSFDEIADEVGYAHKGSAHKAVYKALEEREAAAVRELRHLEGARLDDLQASLWDRALSGDLKAAHAVLRIIDQRIRLFGLADRTANNRKDEPAYLVIGPVEGNPGEITHEQAQAVARRNIALGRME